MLTTLFINFFLFAKQDLGFGIYWDPFVQLGENVKSQSAGARAAQPASRRAALADDPEAGRCHRFSHT